MAANQTPSIGRVVHFVLSDKTHVPAVIINPQENDAGRVAQSLFVMTLGESYGVIAPYDVACGVDTWHWPEHVPAKGEASF